MSAENKHISFWAGQSKEDMLPWIKKYHSLLLTLIMGLAIVIAGVSIIVAKPESSVGGTDNWWPMVLNVAEGRGFVSCQQQYFPFCETADQTTASREPLPILLFAAFATVTHSLVVASIIQLVIFIIALYGTYLLAKRLFNEQVGLIATLMLTLYIPVYRLIPQVSGDMLATALAIWGMYFVVRGLDIDTWVNWVIAGVLLGAGSLSRSVILFVALAVAAMLVPWASVLKQFSFGLFRRSAILVIAVVVTFTPWVVRNYTAFGHIVVGTTLSGYNLYRHNSIILGDNFLRYSNPTDAKQAVERLLANRQDLQGNENEYEMNRVFGEEAQKVILAHPDRYVMLSFYRLLPLWFDIGIDDAYGQKTGLLEIMIIVQQAVLLTLGILGFWLIGHKSWMLWLPILTVTTMHMGVVARLRFLNIVIPLLLISAAFVINYAWEWLAEQRRSPVQQPNSVLSK